MVDSEYEPADSEDDGESLATTYPSLAGPLKLVGFILFMTPIGIGLQTLLLVNSLLKIDDVWRTLSFATGTSPTVIATLMSFELLANLFLIVFSARIVQLFYRRVKVVPRLIIIFLVVSIVIGIVDDFAAAAAMPGAFEGSPEAPLFLRPLVVSIFLIPYLLISKRVKGTFVVG